LHLVHFQQPSYLNPILILFYHLSLGLSSGLSFRFPRQNSVYIYVLPIRSTSSANLSLLDLITIITLARCTNYAASHYVIFSILPFAPFSYMHVSPDTRKKISYFVLLSKWTCFLPPCSYVSAKLLKSILAKCFIDVTEQWVQILNSFDSCTQWRYVKLFQEV
jgi:hypothetical protein